MRTVRDIINQAIAENRTPEYLLYAFATIFVLTGEALIARSVYNHDRLHGMIGIALNALAWPAYHATRAIRTQNLMLRMLEVPLSKARTADEAARMLADTFQSHFKSSPQQNQSAISKVE